MDNERAVLRIVETLDIQSPTDKEHLQRAMRTLGYATTMGLFNKVVSAPGETASRRRAFFRELHRASLPSTAYERYDDLSPPSESSDPTTRQEWDRLMRRTKGIV